MLKIDRQVWLAMMGHVIDGLPEEACGLLAGPSPEAGAPRGGGGDVGSTAAVKLYPCRNLAASARIYELDPLDHLKADRDAEAAGLEIIGVYHSHTHTDAYPSPTDIAQAPDPGWHYVVVSLREPEPVTRSFRIVDGAVEEEPVDVPDR